MNSIKPGYSSRDPFYSRSLEVTFDQPLSSGHVSYHHPNKVTFPELQGIMAESLGTVFQVFLGWVWGIMNLKETSPTGNKIEL